MRKKKQVVVNFVSTQYRIIREFNIEISIHISVMFKSFVGSKVQKESELGFLKVLNSQEREFNVMLVLHLHNNVLKKIYISALNISKLSQSRCLQLFCLLLSHLTHPVCGV